MNTLHNGAPIYGSCKGEVITGELQPPGKARMKALPQADEQACVPMLNGTGKLVKVAISRWDAMKWASEG